MRLLILLSLFALPVFAEEDALVELLPPRPVVSELVNPKAGDRIGFVGIVAAKAETDLGFPLNGTIAERPAEAGDLVSKGDVLAQLDPEDLDSDVRAADAGVTVATARLRSAQDAEGRARQLSGRGVDSETILEDAERALTAAKARLEQARATLEQANDMRGFASLIAPQDGVVTLIYAEAGASLTSGQAVLRLAQTDAREITIDVTEQDAADLDIGTLFDARLAANTDVTAHATLTRIDPVAATSTRTRRVHLTLSEPPVAFRLGALVRVVPAASAEIGVSLDRSAILDPEGAATVWVVDRTTNAVQRVPVELGKAFGSRVRIVDGLAAGDEVIIKGINSLEDGQIVGPNVSE